MVLMIGKENKMFRCYSINMGYWLDPVFDTLKEAIVYGRSKGFEFSVYSKEAVAWKYEGACAGVSLTWRSE